VSGDTVLVMNEAVLELLRRAQIFNFQWRGERWRAGQHLRAPGDGCEIEPYAQVLEGWILPRAMGAFSYSHSELAVNLSIGRYCSIARHVAWMGTSHPTDWATTSPFSYTDAHPAVRAYRAARPDIAPLRSFAEVAPPIEIGHDVWIGEGARIARDVRIGHGAVIGAGALVLKDVPPYAIVGGVPARILRFRMPDALIERFLAVEWWRFAPDVLTALPLDQPEAFLAALEDAIAAGATPMSLQPVTLQELLNAVRTNRISREPLEPRR
jgi:acetyltransferase-like isoleucine patch superfamily enzyme